MEGHDPALRRQDAGESATAPLRILLLAPARSAHTHRWADDLAVRGHTVTVCSWHDPGLQSTRWQARTVLPSGERRPWRMMRVVGRLRRAVDEVQPDVIHVHSLGLHGALSLALPLRAGPRLVTPWGSELRAADRHPGRALVARLALGRAAQVVPTSREVAARVTSRYGVSPSRITVLSWGVPDALLDAPEDDPGPTRARYGIPAHATVALSVRTASPVYRTHEILAAFTRAVRLRPDLFLVLLSGHRPSHAGARRAQQDYLALLRDRASKLAGHVTLVDQPLSQAETYGLMRASDLAISVPRADQRSSSVLEAAAAGCRLLLSDIAPYEELIADGLHADLLPDPLATTLTDALTRARPLAPADRAANSELISRTERGSTKITQLEQLYHGLARMRPRHQDRR